jgi:hypothetical protein
MTAVAPKTKMSLSSVTTASIKPACDIFASSASASPGALCTYQWEGYEGALWMPHHADIKTKQPDELWKVVIQPIRVSDNLGATFDGWTLRSIKDKHGCDTS